MNLAKRIKNSLIIRLINPIINFQKMFLGLKSYPQFIKEYHSYNKLSVNKLKFKEVYPNLANKTKTTSFLAEVGNVEQIKDCIIKLIETEEHELKQIVERGRKIIKKEFNLENEVNKLMNIYSGITKDAK